MDLALLIATCLINLTLGAIILTRDATKTHARLFMLMSVVITVWIVSNFLTNHYQGSVSLVESANRIAYMAGYGIVVSGLAFTYYFPVVRKQKSLETVALVLLIITTFCLSPTSLVAGGVIITDGQVAFTSGPFVGFFLVSFLTLVGFIMRNLIRLPHSVSVKVHHQARLILFAFVFSAVAGLLLNLVIPLLVTGWQITRFGPLSTVVLVTIIAYTIVKHGLFDIRLAAIRTTAYALSLMTLALVYFLLAYIASVTLFKGSVTTGFSMSPINIVLALLLAFIFQPIKQFFDKTTDNIFYRDRYNSDDFIAQLGRILTSTTQIDKLLQLASSEIEVTLKASFTTFVIFREDGSYFLSGASPHGEVGAVDLELLKTLAHGSDEIIVIDKQLGLKQDKDTMHVLRALSKRRIALVLPLMRSTGPIGYLLIGEHNASQYSKRDAKVLEAVSDELVIAIQNSRSVQELRELNKHLQERIDAATKQLRASNAKLTKLDEAKDEFMSMASHQLRTPLTAVKGFLSMVIEGDTGPITKEQSQVLQQAYDSSQRMVFLIGDFLNVSRIQTGKFLMEKNTIDITTLMKQEVAQLTDTAKARKLRFEYEQPAQLPLIEADENKLRQVMMNFMDNAIYYSRPDTTIHVRLYKDHHDIVFKVMDGGIGVPKGEQPHLFTKFFRATNARKQRPDGTGIGLYMAKKVIVAHGGSVIFETKENVGSTFGFRLPLKDDAKKLKDQPATAHRDA